MSESIEPMGYCQTCQYSGADGDYGGIHVCDEPDTTECFNDGRGDTYQCPLWKPAAQLVYCKTHKKWHYSTWELSCQECYQVWEGQLVTINKAGGE